MGFVGLESDHLFTELWKACAGPLVDVPKPNERVFYFPQGHMEQVSFFCFTVFLVIFLCSAFFVLRDPNLRPMRMVLLVRFAIFGLQLQASTNQELDQRIPLFNLPSKILCRVVNTRLLVCFCFFSFWFLFFCICNFFAF